MEKDSARRGLLAEKKSSLNHLNEETSDDREWSSLKEISGEDSVDMIGGRDSVLQV